MHSSIEQVSAVHLRHGLIGVRRTPREHLDPAYLCMSANQDSKECRGVRGKLQMRLLGEPHWMAPRASHMIRLRALRQCPHDVSRGITCDASIRTTVSARFETSAGKDLVPYSSFENMLGVVHV